MSVLISLCDRFPDWDWKGAGDFLEGKWVFEDKHYRMALSKHRHWTFGLYLNQASLGRYNLALSLGNEKAIQQVIADLVIDEARYWANFDAFGIHSKEPRDLPLGRALIKCIRAKAC